MKEAEYVSIIREGRAKRDMRTPCAMCVLQIVAQTGGISTTISPAMPFGRRSNTPSLSGELSMEMFPRILSSVFLGSSSIAWSRMNYT